MILRLAFLSIFVLFWQQSGLAQTLEEKFLKELKEANQEAAEKVEALESRAAAGDPKAMLEIARAYWGLVPMAGGEAEPAFKAQAWAWYEKAARQQIDSEVGKEAVEELVTNYWYQEKLDGLQEWATSGNASAQYYLANRLWKEQARRSEALDWYEKAATNDHLKAIQWMANETENGWFGEANLPVSLKWLTKGAELGDLEMKYQLARRYHFAYGPRWPEFEKDMRKANQLYLDAGNAGHVESLIYLSRLFIMAKSGTNAEIVTNKLMDAKKAEGWFYRGEMYEKGVGRDLNLNKAKANYKKALEMGYSEAEYAIGRVDAAQEAAAKPAE